MNSLQYYKNIYLKVMIVAIVSYNFIIANWLQLACLLALSNFRSQRVLVAEWYQLN